MLNKRIKSLLVAGLLILGMGFAKVDSYAAESKSINLDHTQILLNPSGADYEKDGVTIDVDRIDGNAILDENNIQTGTYGANSYGIIITWDPNKVSYNGAGIITTDDIEREDFNVNVKDGRATLNITLEPGISIKSLAFGYDLFTIEEQIINNYIKQMNDKNIGTRDGSGTRTIGIDYAISQDEWLKVIEQIKVNFNVEKVTEDDSHGEYKVISKFSGDVIETIEIDFFNSDAKSWIPEITPGTGQALAVGGIVIGAAAAVGLLVNNRKRKDEE